MNIVLRNGERAKKPYEYFCRSCQQLRLSWINYDTCGNCGSEDIVKGELETLDKEKLKNEDKKCTKS